jgi:hypothetical protein
MAAAVPASGLRAVSDKNSNCFYYHLEKDRSREKGAHRNTGLAAPSPLVLVEIALT